MKTYWQLLEAQRRTAMRTHALRFREAIHPDSYRSLAQRGGDGVHYVQLAIDYRNMATECAKVGRRA